MKPEISIILTIYNSEKYLIQCLDSLLTQTLHSIEVICVDDASTDQSLDIVRYYQTMDNRIRLIQHSQNKGANYARNMALKKAKGKYIAILDGDDFYKSDFLEKLYIQAEETKADITFCGFYLFNDKNKKSEKIEWDIQRKILPKNPIFFMTPKLFNLLPSFVWNQLYRRDFIQKNHLSFASVRCFTDVYFNKTALLKAERISYVNERLVYYRINNPDSISHNLNALDGIRTIFAVEKFLKSEDLYEKYQNAFFECALQKMNRIQNLLEPYRSLLRSFYQKYLIPKLSNDVSLPVTYPELKVFDTCSDTFKHFFFGCRDHILPIVFSTNKRNVPLMAVAIESIKESANLDYFYDIYILETDLSPATRFNLTQLSEKNIRVTCLNVSNKVDYYMDFENIVFLIPYLFKGYNKILYLANTVLVQSDLVSLFEMDVDNYCLVGESASLYPIQKRRHIVDSSTELDKTISTDVLLWNIPRCKEKKITEKLMNNNKIFRKLKPSTQEIINNLFQSKEIKHSDWGISILYETESIVPNAPLLNYAFKPWINTDNPLSKNWLRVARHSLFYEFIIRNLM